MQPIISILIPNYNSGKYVYDCINSIRKQTFQNWEVVICDSDSSDESREALEQFSKDDERVNFYDVAREGIYAGWNECLKRAKSEYVYIATADDCFSSNLLQVLLEELIENSTADIAYAPLQRIDSEGNACAFQWKDYPSVSLMSGLYRNAHTRNGYSELLRVLCIGQSIISINQALIRRSLLNKTGFFPLSVGSGGDILWQMRALCHTNLVFTPYAQAQWRIYDGQATTRDGKKMMKINHTCREVFYQEFKQSGRNSIETKKAIELMRANAICHGVCPFISKPSLGELLILFYNVVLFFYMGMKRKITKETKPLIEMIIGGECLYSGVRVLSGKNEQ